MWNSILCQLSLNWRHSLFNLTFNSLFGLLLMSIITWLSERNIYNGNYTNADQEYYRNIMIMAFWTKQQGNIATFIFKTEQHIATARQLRYRKCCQLACTVTFYEYGGKRERDNSCVWERVCVCLLAKACERELVCVYFYGCERVCGVKRERDK